MKTKLTETELDNVIGGAWGYLDTRSYKTRPTTKTNELSPQEKIAILGVNNPTEKKNYA